MSEWEEGEEMLMDDNSTVNITHAPGWLNAYSFWMDGVVTLVLVVVGVTGNVSMVVSLVCMAKRWLPLYYYFMAFALWNTALLGSTVFFYCVPALDEQVGASAGQFTYINLLGYLLANSGMTAAIWLVLSVTCERLIVVTRPLDQIVSEPRRRAKIVTSAISILAPIYNLPLFFELELVKNGRDLAKSALRKHTAYKIGYRIVSNMVFLSVLPFLSIIVMSIRIVYVVQNAMASSHSRNNSNQKMGLKRGKTRNSRTRSAGRPSLARDRLMPNSDYHDAQSPVSRCHSAAAQKNAYATHMTLVVLATKFVLCYTLPTVLNILEIVVEPSTLQQEGLGFLVDVSNLMVVADSAFNAFTYMSWRRKIHLHQTRARRRQRSMHGTVGTVGSTACTNSSVKSRNGSCGRGSPMHTRSASAITRRQQECPLIGGRVEEDVM